MDKSSADLAAELKKASELVKVGAIYRHYKSADMTYEVLALAFEEETLSVVVVYRALYGDKLTFTRPVAVWVEGTEFEGKTVPRFALVEGL